MTTTKKGFTLVELMIVIAIIALLSSVTLVALGTSREKAQISKFQQELHSVVIALDLYRQANGHYPPGDAVALNTVIADSSANGLAPYMKSTVVVPPTLSDTDLIYSNNPATDGGGSITGYYSCKDKASSEQYVIYFVNSDPSLSTSDWPEFYSGNTMAALDASSPSTTYRCAVVGNK